MLVISCLTAILNKIITAVMLKSYYARLNFHGIPMISTLRLKFYQDALRKTAISNNLIGFRC